MAKSRFPLTLLRFIFVISVFLAASRAIAQGDSIAEFTSTASLFDASWSPDSQFLAVAGSWGTKIFDRELREITSLKTHSNNDISVSWAPSGQILAVGGGIGDTRIRIWDFYSSTNTFELETTLRTGKGGIFSLAWSPNGMHLAALRAEQASPQDMWATGTVYIWDTDTWKLETTLKTQFTSPVKGLGWSSDSSKIIGSGNPFCINTCDAFQDAGNVIYVADILSGEIIQVTDLFDPTVLAVSNHQQIAATGYNLDVYSLNVDYSFNLLLDLRQEDYGGYYTLLAWNSDGGLIAAGNGGGMINIFDVNTVEVILSLSAPPNIYNLAWSPDDQLLSIVHDDGLIELYDVSLLSS